MFWQQQQFRKQTSNFHHLHKIPKSTDCMEHFWEIRRREQRFLSRYKPTVTLDWSCLHNMSVRFMRLYIRRTFSDSDRTILNDFQFPVFGTSTWRFWRRKNSTTMNAEQTWSYHRTVSLLWLWNEAHQIQQSIFFSETFASRSKYQRLGRGATQCVQLLIAIAEAAWLQAIKRHNFSRHALQFRDSRS